MPYELLFLKGLLLTVAAEITAATVVRILGGNSKLLDTKAFQKIPWPLFILGIAFASLLTLPYVWFVFPIIQPRWLFGLIAELFAWIMEAIFYRLTFQIVLKKAFVFSFLLNLFSFLLGLLIFQYL